MSITGGLLSMIVPRCSLYAKPRIFGSRLRGSGTSAACHCCNTAQATADYDDSEAAEAFPDTIPLRTCEINLVCANAMV
jgi:hypothetical protein